MKKMSRKIAAFLCSVMTMTCLPAFHADAETLWEDDMGFVEPIWWDYAPNGFDRVRVTVPQHENVKVQIFQHSPERENLLLFDAGLAAGEEDSDFYFQMEPGDYTIRIFANTVKDGFVNTLYTDDFTVENPDYSAEPHVFAQGVYTYKLQMEEINELDDSRALATQPEITYEDQLMERTREVTFGRYERLRGDFDDDHEITAMDAQAVLNHFLASMLEDPNAEGLANPAQFAACDIDGDKELSAADAQYILSYFADSVAGVTPSWSDVNIPDDLYA